MTLDLQPETVQTPDAHDTPSSRQGLDITVNENRYFQTQVFTFQLNATAAAPLNRKLLDLVHEERDRDAEGLEKSNFRALGGWHSKSDLHKRAEFSALARLIEMVAGKVAAANAYDPAFPLRIGTMWSIINQPGSANNAHVHPSSQWSGVYYIQAPENSGQIEFTDPRIGHTMAPAKYARGVKRPTPCWGKVTFTPVAGKLIMFPSWLYHAVAPNLSTGKGEEGERVIVSFNLNQMPA
ncbi:MAG: TIGR02466 family protein [Pseudomonadota bacterium]